MPTAANVDSGSKDAKNRTIWIGPKGGRFVRVNGKKAKPSVAAKKPARSAPATSPRISTGKVDAKKREVFGNSKGRTYVKHGDKKVYVKKLFTPKSSPRRPAPTSTRSLVKLGARPATPGGTPKINTPKQFFSFAKKAINSYLVGWQLSSVWGSTHMKDVIIKGTPVTVYGDITPGTDVVALYTMGSPMFAQDGGKFTYGEGRFSSPDVDTPPEDIQDLVDEAWFLWKNMVEEGRHS